MPLTGGQRKLVLRRGTGMASLKTFVFKLWLIAFRLVGVRLMPKRQAIPEAPRVAVMGLHASIRGIGETGRLFVKALKSAGRGVNALTLDDRLMLDAAARADAGEVIISHLNPPELEAFLMRRAPPALLKTAHIGYWVWELERIPRHWRAARHLVDAIWTPSQFSADAIRAGLSESRRVSVLPPPIFAAQSAPFDRTRLGVREASVLALAVCDLRSTAARKNPYGALEAFCRAADRAPGAADLIVKIVGADAEPAAFTALKDAISGRDDVTLYTDSLTDGEMLGLIAQCDIAVSLHRSEGFGLLAAHGAYAGRAVVATNWSAPTEFLTCEGAALIDFSRRPVDDPQGLYPSGYEWAEPDLDMAADALERLIADPDERSRMGKAAREAAEARFGQAAWLTRFDALIEEARG